ncbi:MAG: hypothetical protein KC615_18920 [Anaerolineae bacterium]|nr:hypothetical protein [Anaerolineae bacterium]
MHINRALRFLALLSLLLIVAIGTQAQEYEQLQKQAIMLAMTQDDFVDFLEGVNWEANAYPNDDSEYAWTVEFFDMGESGDDWDWMGYVVVDIHTGNIYEAYAARPKSDEEVAAMEPRLLDFVLNDAAILASLENPDEWGHWVGYDRWEGVWNIGFYRGLDAIAATIRHDEEFDTLAIEDIYDPNALDEMQQTENDRANAISLAYEAQDIWQHLEGHDEWYTYAQPQGDGIWSVTFSSDDQPLFYALVNINEWQILEIH